MSPTSLADIGCSPSGPHAAELRVRLVDDPRSMKHIASCQPRIFYESRSVNLGFAGLCSVASRVLSRSEEHTSELQSRLHLVCRLLLEKKKETQHGSYPYATYPHTLV